MHVQCAHTHAVNSRLLIRPIFYHCRAQSALKSVECDINKVININLKFYHFHGYRMTVISELPKISRITQK